MAEGGSMDSCVTNIVREEIVESEDADRIMCDPCSRAKEQNTAVQFCIDCQDCLCESCTNAHRKSKPSKNHKLIDLSESSITSIHKLKQLGDATCEKHHDKQVEVFCFTHNVYCCILCATVNHKECTCLMEIPKLATTADEKMTKLGAMYKTARTHIATLRSLCEKEKKEIPRKVRHLEDTLDQIRDQIVSEVDAVIQDQKGQVKNKARLCDAELDTRLSTLKDIESSCKENEDRMTTAKEYGLPIHIVTTQRRTTDEYLKTEKEIETVEKKITQFEFDCPVMARLETLRQGLVNCRSEKVKTDEKKLYFNSYEDSVNSNARRDMKKVDEYTLQLVPMCTPTYTGIATLGTNQVFLSDNCGHGACGHICMYNTETKSMSKLRLHRPFGAAVMKSQPTEIAVSLPEVKEIKLMSFRDESFSVVSTFRTEKVPYSLIHLENGLFGVTFDSPPSFDIVDIRGKEMKTLKTYTQDSTGRQFKSFQYVAVDELRSHIIQPCDVENKVFCFDLAGHPVFTYEDRELKTPRGVCLDTDGNIYIGSQKGIHVLTPAGRTVKVITEGIPTNVCAIRFDTVTKVFLTAVLGNYEKLFHFELK